MMGLKIQFRLLHVCHSLSQKLQEMGVGPPSNNMCKNQGGGDVQEQEGDQVLWPTGDPYHTNFIRCTVIWEWESAKISI